MRKIFKFKYTSPRSQAQKSQRAEGLFAFYERVLPLAQADPRVMEVLDLRRGLGKAAEWMDVPVEALVSPEEYAALQARREAAEGQEREMAVTREAAQAFQSAARGAASLAKEGGGGGTSYLQRMIGRRR